MIDQTVAGQVIPVLTHIDLKISPSERKILRKLADQVAEIAARPIEQEKRQLWYDHNALRITRPLIFCDPENGWNEIIMPLDLECQNNLARQWEMTLRKEIFWGTQMGDDRVIEPYFNVAHIFSETDWGMRETKIGGKDGGSYRWDAPLKNYADLDILHFPKITIDWKSTTDLLDLSNNIFGNILSTRLKTAWWWTLGMTWTLVNLRGLSQMMYDMADQPEYLHRLMAFLRDGTLSRLNFLEQNDLLSMNNDGSYIGSGGFGWSNELPQPDFNGKVRTIDMWGFAESQETVGISPRMFEEFVYPYQLPLLELFGLNCYGCCEPLDKRWHVVEKFPRLRRISVSAWANISKMAEYLGNRYIFSWKPAPSDLALPYFDPESIRLGLRQMIARTRDCRVEIIMKDNHTIANEPLRVIRWVQIAKEEASA